LFYQQKRETKPSLSGATGKNYYFTSNSVANEVKNAGWDVKTPEMEAGTASNKYWSVPFTAVQNAPSSDGVEATTGPLSFGSVTRAFAFNQVVTFDSLESEGTTIINGASIKTGAIQSQNYSNSSGDDYSSNGMKIDLTGNGSIHAKEFYINADGTSSFTGKHTAGELGNWQVENGSLKDSTNRIELNPGSQSIDLKDESGEVKARVRSSTSLQSTDLGSKRVIFSSSSSLKINLKEQVTVPSTSSLTTRFTTKYSRISNDIALEAGGKWEAKASEIPFSTFDISDKWLSSEKNEIPAISYSVTQPSQSVKNTFAYGDFAEILISQETVPAYVERELVLQFVRRTSNSTTVVKSVTLTKSKRTGAFNFEKWNKNAASTYWYSYTA
jgi:hypothetical protein